MPSKPVAFSLLQSSTVSRLIESQGANLQRQVHATKAMMLGAGPRVGQQGQVHATKAMMLGQQGGVKQVVVGGGGVSTQVLAVIVELIKFIFAI